MRAAADLHAVDWDEARCWTRHDGAYIGKHVFGARSEGYCSGLLEAEYHAAP